VFENAKLIRFKSIFKRRLWLLLSAVYSAAASMAEMLRVAALRKTQRISRERSQADGRLPA
jgi:hypothetical protein